MINIFKNIPYKLIFNDKYYEITAFERISIRSLEKKVISLPILRDELSNYINFELSYQLSLDGVQCLWTNINEESSKSGIKLILNNTNFDLYKTTALESITGSKNRIDIKPGDIIGRFYIN